MTYKQEWLKVVAAEIKRLRKALKLAAVLALALAFSVMAQAPAPDTFTVNPNCVLTSILYHSYCTYYLETFEGNAAYGTMVLHDDTQLWDFTFPNLSLTGCPQVSDVGSTAYVTSTYKIVTLTASYSCAGPNATTYAIQTVTTKRLHLSWCRFKACWTDVLPNPPISGTVTAD